MRLPINLPARVVKDQPVTATWANSIREAIWRLSQRKEIGFGGGGGGSTEIKPLQIVRGTEPNKIKITLGTVNAGYPTIATVGIDTDPAPEITLADGTHYVWLRTIATFGSPYPVTVETTSTTSPPSTPSVTPTTFTSCFYIGYVVVDSGVITSIVNVYGGGNLGVESFGAANLWWAI
jgi:hypothetical protein